jgi:predicted HicB family RNase H-like nuclease
MLFFVPQESPSERPGEERKTFPFRIPPKLHKKLKRKAVDQDRTMQEMCLEALEQYLETQ